MLRLLRGESLEVVSRELGVSRQGDRRVAKLERKIGELMMECELLREKAKRLEVLAPNFPWRRSRG